MTTSEVTFDTMGSRLLRNLSSRNKEIFTISDAMQVTGTNPVATRMLLSDLVKKKWLIRLVPGKYLVVPLSAGEDAQYSENWYVVAKHLVEPNPYYLSHYSALDIHGMTTQPLMRIYITTSIRRQERMVLGASFRFVFTQTPRIWGVEEEWIKPSVKVSVSDLERTVIDCLDNPKYCGGISELAKGLWRKRSELDYSKLVQYVERFGRNSVAKRLGFLLDMYKIGEEATDDLRRFITPDYVLLDPSLPAQGKHKSKWRVRINLDTDELLEIIAT